VPIERPGNVLSRTNDERWVNEGGGPVGAEASSEDRVHPDAEAEAFIRFCYRRRAVKWPELYDEMCAVAARGAYRGMDYEELQRHGIGFALSSLPRLAELAARVIAQERKPQPIAAVA
jgi:hypothetical protein